MGATVRDQEHSTRPVSRGALSEVGGGRRFRPVPSRFPHRAQAALFIVIVCVALIGLVLLFLNRDAPRSSRWGFWGFQSLMGLLSGSTGILITRRHPHHPIGWMLLAAGFFSVLTGLSEEFAIYALYIRTDWLPLATVFAGAFNWLWVISYALMAIYIPLLFPNGRFENPRWRIVAYLGAAWMVLGAAWIVILPGSMPNNGGLENPFGLEALRGTAAAAIGPHLGVPLLGTFLMLAAGCSLVLRYRRAREITTRQQLKWLAYAALLMPFAGMIGHLPGFVPNLLVFAFAAAAPLAVAVAVLRYRLYDIDVLINRTLVYGALTALVLGVYALVVVATGAIAQAQSSSTAATAAVVVVAILFHPARARLQQGVNRLLYGERDAPLAVLSQLGKHIESALSPEDMLSALAETVAKALKLPYVAIVLGNEDPAIVAEFGRPTHYTAAFPIVYRGQTAGRLLVAPRQPGDAFNDTDRALLENIARQAGAAAHAARLTSDLRRSQQRLVTAREEERRRLRRDLHDDLGPRLASMTLTIDAAMRQLRQNPNRAEEMLRVLKAQAQTAVQEIRYLVNDLRPPALDELGLAAALRESATRYAQSGVRFSVDAPDPLPPLPAAVEVATFRIAQEAITNTVRHANARSCRVRIQPQPDHLYVVVEDDGQGLPEGLQLGVGLRSMRERVAELGGRLTLENREGGGAIVRAWLPLLEAT